MPRATGRDSTDMIVSRELLGKVGSAAEWGDSMDDIRKAGVFLLLACQSLFLYLNVYQHSLERGRQTPLCEEQVL